MFKPQKYYVRYSISEAAKKKKNLFQLVLLILGFNPRCNDGLFLGIVGCKHLFLVTYFPNKRNAGFILNNLFWDDHGSNERLFLGIFDTDFIINFLGFDPLCLLRVNIFNKFLCGDSNQFVI